MSALPHSVLEDLILWSNPMLLEVRLSQENPVVRLQPVPVPGAVSVLKDTATLHMHM